MKQKLNVFLLLAILLLAGCENNKSDDSSLPVDNGSSSSQTTIIDGSSSESNSESSSSEELPPIDDPAISGLVRSEEWPSADLNNFLTYTANFVMPELKTETSFHHGLYEGYGLFYRVVTRVRKADAFAAYQLILEDDYDFSFQIDEYGDTYGESFYGEVKLNLYVEVLNNFYEVIFDFYDGDEYIPKGLVAVDNVALFDFFDQSAVVKKSTSRVKWEVHPVTFSVSRGSAGYPVGNTNYNQLTNPLHIYAGNIVNFQVDNRFYISEIKILAASGYALRFSEQGDFDTTNLAVDVGGDWITIAPSGKISTLTYTRQNVTNVGQTRFVRLTVKIARK